MNSNDDPERGLSDKEAAHLAGVSRSLLRKHENDPRRPLRSYKLGGCRVYRRADVLAWRECWSEKNDGLKL
jgi:predicted DNA-binding transcriptional regulator AlpA